MVTKREASPLSAMLHDQEAPDIDGIAYQRHAGGSSTPHFEQAIHKNPKFLMA
jgi:hypothetical protein